MESMCLNADITTMGKFNSTIGFQLKKERQNKPENTGNKWMVPAMPHSSKNYERIMWSNRYEFPVLPRKVLSD